MHQRAPGHYSKDKASVNGTPALPTELKGTLVSKYFVGLMMKLDSLSTFTFLDPICPYITCSVD